MRSLQLLGLLAPFAAAAEKQTAPLNSASKSLPEVFGAVEPVYEMSAWHVRHTHRVGRPEGYFARRSPVECTFPLEIVILQDATRSFEDDLPEMRDVQLPLMVSALTEVHPNSTFSVVSFRDKPIWSLGEPRTDYCQKFDLPLTAVTTELTAVYDTMEAVGGGDPSENQFGSLVALSQSNTVGWKNAEAAKLVVVVTDAPPHFEGDGLNGYEMEKFSGTFDEAQAMQQCTKEYYPTPDQVRTALDAREAYTAYLVFDGEWWNSLPSESWKWFNSFVGQSDAFVRPLDASSTEFWAQLARVISDIEAIECVAPPLDTTEEEVKPTGPPVIPTVTPVIPIVTPVIPTVTPVIPIVTPVIPTVTPVGTTQIPPTPVSELPPPPPSPFTELPPPPPSPFTELPPPPPSATETEIVCPLCVVDPCPPCEGECCHQVDIRLRKKPSHLKLDMYN